MSDEACTISEERICLSPNNCYSTYVYSHCNDAEERAFTNAYSMGILIRGALGAFNNMNQKKYTWAGSPYGYTKVSEPSIDIYPQYGLTVSTNVGTVPGIHIINTGNVTVRVNGAPIPVSVVNLPSNPPSPFSILNSIASKLLNNFYFYLALIIVIITMVVLSW